MESGAVLNPQIAYGEDVVSRLGYASVSADNYRRIRGAVVEGAERSGCGTLPPGWMRDG
ncbi:MAG: hypothetical protein AB1609_19485 [Bacillota bacterium]